VALGMSNKEIAANFEISVRTVENHISHILAKKNFDNRVEIARYVLARQI
jgi:DNA-binding NarL/FixJ family response regulator